MKTYIAVVLFFGFLNVAQAKEKCDLEKVERTLVEDLGVSKNLGHAYVLAYENFLLNLEMSNVTLKSSVYDGELGIVKQVLTKSYGLDDLRADSVVTSMKMVRLISDETGIKLTDSSCLGESSSTQL